MTLNKRCLRREKSNCPGLTRPRLGIESKLYAFSGQRKAAKEPHSNFLIAKRQPQQEHETRETQTKTRRREKKRPCHTENATPFSSVGNLIQSPEPARDQIP